MVNEQVLQLVEGKYRKEYARRYGVENLINQYHGLPWRGNRAELIYKKCLQSNTTWQNLYNVKENNNILY